MSSYNTKYNERSWAIDLIGIVKSLSGGNNRKIKDAGGEHTISVEGGSLFPDVLLFGDRESATILQGWELKFPDTDINNVEFYENAKLKAKALGLNSFLLWNVSIARLFVEVDNEFDCVKEWRELIDISSRGAVRTSKERWKKLAEEIIGYLNDLFENGTIEGRQFIEAYKSGGVTSLIMHNAGGVADAIKLASRANITLRAQMQIWWDIHQGEYNKENLEIVLAQVIISNWIGKILFANILRENDSRAAAIFKIDESTTPIDALKIFERLSNDCNFWTIFSDDLGLAYLTDQAWRQLKEFNKLLNDLRLGSVDQSQLSNILEATVEVSTRKLRGQYPTPIELARLLVHLCVRNIESDRVLDPCCGSGTIVRAALEQKLDAEVPAPLASSKVFASDLDPQAIQITTFAMARPELMHVPLRIFKHDAFKLVPELEIEFRNPSNGQPFKERVGTYQAIVSNLPFVAQNGRKRFGNALDTVVRMMSLGDDFSRRTDVSAYLPFALYPLLSENGRLGIIITNAWLGTNWGNHFYYQLKKFYKLRSVITSGAGRWFNNSEVVTNILILDKIGESDDNSNDGTNFIVLTRPLEELCDSESVRITAAQIEIAQTQNETMTIRSVSENILERFRQLGLGGNAQFVNCDWLLDFPLTPLKNIFNLKRGERRGLNALFYPSEGHGIESDYIKPFVKSPADFSSLKCTTFKDAFSCSLDEAELSRLGHTGAVNWIRRFKTQDNIDKLSRANLLWYQMNTNSLADLVMFINYSDRLFVGRIDPPAFIDQRLISLVPHNAVDIELYHALLNCSISLFILEGMGFGRGLGALDLNKDWIEEYMHVLDVSVLNSIEIENIKTAFGPLVTREIFSIADELEQPDRQNFDDTIIAAFKLNITRNVIYDALLSLVEIRNTVRD